MCAAQPKSRGENMARVKRREMELPVPGLIELVIVNGTAMACLIPQPLTSDQMRVVRSILPSMIARPALNKAWHCWGVLASDGWVEAEKITERPTGLVQLRVLS